MTLSGVSNDGIMNNGWNRCIRKLSCSNSSAIPAFAWRDWVKPQNPSVMIDGVSAEIRTGASQIQVRRVTA
jgi:hypothetical protein